MDDLLNTTAAIEPPGPAALVSCAKDIQRKMTDHVRLRWVIDDGEEADGLHTRVGDEHRAS